MASLLVIEDDDTIGGLLASGLRANGYEVSWHRTGAGGLAEAAQQAFDLVVLDLGLPDVDGLQVCQQLRQLSPLVVIVILTARTDEMEVVAGLEFGADDYLTKPFGLVELLARIRAHLRRSTGTFAGDRPQRVVLGSLTVDAAARRVSVAGDPVALRPREFDLLVRLVQDAGTAVTRETLMSDVWDENWFGSTKTLDVHVASLRRKLATVAAQAGSDAEAGLPTLTTLRGHGYRLDPR